MDNSKSAEDIFKEYFINGVKKSFNEVNIRSLLNRGNNLSRLNILNRIMISGQLKEATTDVRTWAGWRKVGRELNKNIETLIILLPLSEYKYVDTEKGNEVTNRDLNGTEMQKAIQYGIVKIVENVSKLIPVEVFTKEDTHGEEVEAGNRVSLAQYVEFMYRVTDGEIQKGDKVRTVGDIVCISESDTRASAQEICNYIAGCITRDVEKEKEFKKRALAFAMLSIIHTEYTLELIEALEEDTYSIEQFSELLTETDGFINKVLLSISEESVIKDNTQEMINEQKGKTIASIYEAVELREVSRNVNRVRMIDKLLKS